MKYNIHPIFVHFPIAFLLLYVLVKIIPFKNKFPNISWKHIELTSLILGVFGAFVASSTGEIAEHITKAPRDIVEMHSLFAGISTWIFTLLLIGEVLNILLPKIKNIQIPYLILKTIEKIKNVLTHTYVSVFFAILGVVAITITGVLGGVLVYGTTADPVAPFVLKILGL